MAPTLVIPDISTTPQELVDAAFARVNELDLAPVESLLVREGDTAEAAGGKVAAYRKFLALALAYPELKLVPTKQADGGWHAHILHTKLYFEQTTALFGAPLHHYPDLGPRDEDGRSRLKEKGDITRALLKAHFVFDDGDGPLDTGWCGECEI
jgi:hypothetical protein